MNIIIGALLVIYKRESLSVILIISGIFLVINGAIAVIGCLMDKNVIGTVLGAIFIGVGIALIILPNLFTDIFMILLAILLIVMGISGGLSTFDKPENGVAGIIFSLVISIVMIFAGVYTLFNLETTADWLMIVIGVIMIITGVLNIIGGLVSRYSIGHPQ